MGYPEIAHGPCSSANIEGIARTHQDHDQIGQVRKGGQADILRHRSFTSISRDQRTNRRRRLPVMLKASVVTKAKWDVSVQPVPSRVRTRGSVDRPKSLSRPRSEEHTSEL